MSAPFTHGPVMPRSKVVLPALFTCVALGLYFWFRRAAPSPPIPAPSPPQPETVFQTQLEGRPITFVARDCRIYIRQSGGAETQVLRPGFAFGLARCEAQTIAMERDYVVAQLQTFTFGAGAPTWDVYRSKDGIAWERRFDSRWVPVEKAQL
jgi:hypothetical protein